MEVANQVQSIDILQDHGINASDITKLRSAGICSIAVCVRVRACVCVCACVCIYIVETNILYHFIYYFLLQLFPIPCLQHDIFSVIANKV